MIKSALIKKIVALSIGVIGPLGILLVLKIWTKDDVLVFFWAFVLIPISLGFLLLWVATDKPKWLERWWALQNRIGSPWKALKKDFENSPPRIKRLLILLLVIIIGWLTFHFLGPSDSSRSFDPFGQPDPYQ